jgi:aryl sulfotransferase
MPSTLPERTREYRNHHLDSTRWDGFVARDDDIVVTTAYKAGTTWTQRILAALLVPGSVDLMAESPWVDARFHGRSNPCWPQAQEHRRFVKAIAADGLLFYPQVKYVVVSATRDVFMSLWNHYSAYTDLAYSLFNDTDRPGPEFPRAPESPRELWPRWISEGWFDWEPDGWPFWSHHHHLSTWQLRDLRTSLHALRDMLADIEGRCAALAFCEIDVDGRGYRSSCRQLGCHAGRREEVDGRRARPR